MYEFNFFIMTVHFYYTVSVRVVLCFYDGFMMVVSVIKVVLIQTEAAVVKAEDKQSIVCQSMPVFAAIFLR